LQQKIWPTKHTEYAKIPNAAATFLFLASFGMFSGSFLREAIQNKEHRLSSLCAQRRFTPLTVPLGRVTEAAGLKTRWLAQAAGPCSSDKLPKLLVSHGSLN